MGLTWKDAAATLLVGGMAVVTYAKVKGFDWPMLGSWRLASIVLLVVGLVTCIVGNLGATPTKDWWGTTGTILGVGVMVLALANLIFNSSLLFWAIAADLLALWLLTTTHHLVMS